MNDEAVVKALADAEQSVEELIVNTGLSADEVNFTLGRLIINERVQRQYDNGVLLWRLA